MNLYRILEDITIENGLGELTLEFVSLPFYIVNDFLIYLILIFSMDNVNFVQYEYLLCNFDLSL